MLHSEDLVKGSGDLSSLMRKKRSNMVVIPSPIRKKMIATFHFAWTASGANLIVILTTAFNIANPTPISIVISAEFMGVSIFVLGYVKGIAFVHRKKIADDDYSLEVLFNDETA